MSRNDCLGAPSLCETFRRTARASQPACPGAASGPVIHIVGKDAALRRGLAMRLRTAGYCAQAFPSTLAFVRAAADGRDGCLLVDHQPDGGVDALALLERLPAVGVTLPVIVIAASADARLRRAATALGAVGVLTKPATPDAVLNAVAGALVRTAA